MDSNLQKLREANIRLQEGNEKFKDYKERWYGWNYWAWHRYWYSQWMKEHKLEISDIRAMKKFEREDIIFSREEGWRYYNEWRGAKQALSDLDGEFDAIFEYCWNLKARGRQKKTRTGHAYSGKDLAEALQVQERSVYKRAESRSWYEPRKQNGNSN